MSDDWRKKYKGTNTIGQKILGVFGPDCAGDILIVIEGLDDNQIYSSYNADTLVPIEPVKVEAWVVIDSDGRQISYYDKVEHAFWREKLGQRLVKLTGEYKEYAHDTNTDN